MKLSRWWAAALLAALLAVPLGVFAQGDLTQSFTSQDGLFAFNYPDGWTAEEFSGTIVVANAPEGLDVFSAGDSVTGDLVVIAILTPASLAEQLGSLADFDAESLLNLFLGDVAGGVTTEAGEIAGKPAAFGSATEEGETLTAFAVDYGAGGIALIVQVSAEDKAQEFEATTRAVIESMTALDLPAAPTAEAGGAVVWQQIYDVDAEGTSGFTYADQVSVGPDDAIYVLDSAAGVHWFDADGNYQGVIAPEGSYGGLLAFDAASDGSLWVVDFFGAVMQIDASGAQLAGFDLSDSVDMAFFGVDLALGPDGNLYLLNPHETDDGGDVGEVLVFTPAGELINSFELGVDEYFYEASIAFGPDGNLYVAEYFGKQGVRVFSLSGELLREGVGAATLFNIADVAVGPDGSIYATVSDSPVYRFGADGALLAQFGESLWFQDDFDSEAETTAKPAPGVFYNVGGLGVLSNGDVVIADASDDWWQLVRVSFEG